MKQKDAENQLKYTPLAKRAAEEYLVTLSPEEVVQLLLDQVALEEIVTLIGPAVLIKVLSHELKQLETTQRLFHLRTLLEPFSVAEIKQAVPFNILQSQNDSVENLITSIIHPYVVTIMPGNMYKITLPYIPELELKIYIQTGEIKISNEKFNKFSPDCMTLLIYLLHNAETFFTQKELIKNAMNHGPDYSENSLQVLINRVRSVWLEVLFELKKRFPELQHVPYVVSNKGYKYKKGGYSLKVITWTEFEHIPEVIRFLKKSN